MIDDLLEAVNKHEVRDLTQGRWRNLKFVPASISCNCH